MEGDTGADKHETKENIFIVMLKGKCATLINKLKDYHPLQNSEKRERLKESMYHLFKDMPVAIP